MHDNLKEKLAENRVVGIGVDYETYDAEHAADAKEGAHSSDGMDGSKDSKKKGFLGFKKRQSDSFDERKNPLQLFGFGRRKSQEEVDTGKKSRFLMDDESKSEVIGKEGNAISFRRKTGRNLRLPPGRSIARRGRRGSNKDILEDEWDTAQWGHGGVDDGDYLRNFLYEKRNDQSCSLPHVLARGLDKHICRRAAEAASGIVVLLKDPLRQHRMASNGGNAADDGTIVSQLTDVSEGEEIGHNHETSDATLAASMEIPATVQEAGVA